VLDPGEECEDGNRVDDDGCSAQCQRTTTITTTNFGGRVCNGDPSEDIPRAAVRYPSGQVFVAGEVDGASSCGDLRGFARYTALGDPDLSFGNGTGRLRPSTGGATIVPTAGVLQQDGAVARMVIAGRRADGAFRVTRNDIDGNADTSFGVMGHATADFGAPRHAEPSSVVNLLDGSLLVVGTVEEESFDGTGDVALARFSKNGAGPQGTIVRDFDGGHDRAIGAVRQPDGKVVVVAESFAVTDEGHGPGGLVLTRSLADGLTLDPSFGTGGKTLIADGPCLGEPEAVAVAVQDDGKVVIAGLTLCLGFGHRAMLLRLMPDGDVDLDFGTNGFVVDPWFDDSIFAGASALVIQPDGRILVTGVVLTNDPAIHSDFVLARYLPDGKRDPTFGDVRPFDVPGASQVAGRVILLADFSSLASTTAYIVGPVFSPEKGYDFAVIRHRITETCGDGNVSDGEACDEGSGNGQASSCCTRYCTHVPDQQSCDDGFSETHGDRCVAGTCAGTVNPTTTSSTTTTTTTSTSSSTSTTTTVTTSSTTSSSIGGSTVSTTSISTTSLVGSTAPTSTSTTSTSVAGPPASVPVTLPPDPCPTFGVDKVRCRLSFLEIAASCAPKPVRRRAKKAARTLDVALSSRRGVGSGISKVRNQLRGTDAKAFQLFGKGRLSVECSVGISQAIGASLSALDELGVS
jgi:uncharacterized delta-60 repeat protein